MVGFFGGSVLQSTVSPEIYDLFNSILRRDDGDIYRAIKATYVKSQSSTLATVDLVVILKENKTKHIVARTLRYSEDGFRAWGLSFVCPYCSAPTPSFEMDFGHRAADDGARLKCWMCLWAIPSLRLKAPPFVENLGNSVFACRHPMSEDPAELATWLASAILQWEAENPLTVSTWMQTSSYRMHQARLAEVKAHRREECWPPRPEALVKEWEKARVKAAGAVEQAKSRQLAVGGGPGEGEGGPGEGEGVIRQSNKHEGKKRKVLSE